MELPNGELYRARGGLADKSHSVEPVAGAESLRDEAKPAPRPVQAMLAAVWQTLKTAGKPKCLCA